MKQEIQYLESCATLAQMQEISHETAVTLRAALVAKFASNSAINWIDDLVGSVYISTSPTDNGGAPNLYRRTGRSDGVWQYATVPDSDLTPEMVISFYESIRGTFKFLRERNNDQCTDLRSKHESLRAMLDDIEDMP